MGRGRADEAIAPERPCRAQHRNLGIFREVVVDLAITPLDLGAHACGIERVATGELAHAADELVERVAHDEVRALVEEGLHGRGRPFAEARAQEQQPDVFARQVGVLLAARERELLFDDALREHEPRVVVTGCAQVRERAERVETREEGDGQPRPGRVEPDR